MLNASMIEWDIPEDVVINVPAPRIIADVEQGSDEWLEMRAGIITGSKISNMVAEGGGVTREKYKIQLAVERITGRPVPQSFKSRAMIKGNEDEPLAREHYEFINDVDAEQVAFIYHATLSNAGASPDSLIGDDGMLEIKCPNMETHIGYLLSKKIPRGYMLQMQWQMACAGRAWCDWMTYCKELPIHLRAMIIRVPRDEKIIDSLEKTAAQFDREVEELIQQLGELK